MAVKYTTTAQASKLNGVKVLTYGGAGMGKTTLCITAPKPCIISAESGLLALAPGNIARMEQQVQRALPRDVPVIEVTTFRDLQEAYTFAASPQAAGFETFCLDSISEIAERVLTNAKATVKDPRQAYGQLIEDTLTVIRAFRDLPGKHVYFSAKQELVKDESTGTAMYGPSMPGKQLGPGLPYYFDEVFNLNVAKTPQGQSYRFLRTSPDFQYTAKDRSGALSEIERPDLTYIFNKIAGG
jgi:hypothetical protein